MLLNNSAAHCMYLSPHFDINFQIPLLVKYDQLGSIVIRLTAEVSY